MLSDPYLLFPVYAHFSHWCCSLQSHQQVIEVDVQRELEEMEKETDIDDILNYRAIAERALEVEWCIIWSLILIFPMNFASSSYLTHFSG